MSQNLTDRELLEQLATFLRGRNFITGDAASIKDMVQRYQQPPLTMLNRVGMQMTLTDYRQLGVLLETISNHLKEADVEPVQSEPV